MMNNLQIAEKIAHIVNEELTKKYNFYVNTDYHKIYGTYRDSGNQSYFDLEVETKYGLFSSIIKVAWVEVMFQKHEEDNYFVKISLDYMHFDYGRNGKTIARMFLDSDLNLIQILFEDDQYGK